jgi:hypothetical protein
MVLWELGSSMPKQSEYSPKWEVIRGLYIVAKERGSSVSGIRA